MRPILLFLLMSTTFYARAETTSTVNIAALENLVFMSAYVQDKWPAVHQDTFGDTTSVVALNETLNIIAVAQEISRTQGEQLLLKVTENPKRFAELGFKYAKYSNCAQATKIKLFKSALNAGPHKNDSLLTGLVAFELLKCLPDLEPREVEPIVVSLKRSLLKYKSEDVYVARYWRLMLEFENYMQINHAFAQLIKRGFSDDLLHDIAKARTVDAIDPNFFGINLYYHEIYDTVPKQVRDFWCRIWCGVSKSNSR